MHRTPSSGWSGPLCSAKGALPQVEPTGQLGPVSRLQNTTCPGDEKLSVLEERVRIIKGSGRHGLDITDLCLVLDVVLPANFKVPKFEKYKGSSCPRVHLAMYYKKMTSYTHQDKILDSLTRAALCWYTGLEKGHTKKWRDLAEAFLQQYKYNEDMGLDRSRLQNLSKTEFRGFKDYAQRWHELATQVQPPLTEKEMVTMFIDTLPSPFYDKAVGSLVSNFANLVTVGERIESNIKRGKFAQANNDTSFVRRSNQERRKGEANAIIIDPSNLHGQGKGLGIPQIILSKPRTSTPTTMTTSLKAEIAYTSNAQGIRPEQQRRLFTPIPMTYTTLYPLLLQNNMIAILQLKPLEPPYPRNYDPNTKCDYHTGVVGHSTEKCWGFMHKVQDLIDRSWLSFKEKEPNMNNNHLPPHWGKSINILSHESSGQEPSEVSSS
ncbi:hypothetical protein CR513_52414, partial [Mucuna pruriens]